MLNQAVDTLNVLNKKMGFLKISCNVILLHIFIVIGLAFQCSAIQADANQTATLLVDASDASGRKIPDTFFGIFFEVSNKLVTRN